MLGYIKIDGKKFWKRQLRIENHTVHFPWGSVQCDFEETFPTYKSLEGFLSWGRTLQDELGLSEAHALVQLLVPDEDLRWTERFSEEKVMEVVNNTSPFHSKEHNLKLLEIMLRWDTGIHIRDVIQNVDACYEGKPRDTRELYHMKDMVKFSTINRHLRKYHLLKCKDRSMPERLALALEGVIRPQLVDLIRKKRSLVHNLIFSYGVEKALEFVREIDPEYFTDITWRGLVASGVSHKTLLGKFPFNKRERHEAILLYGFMDSLHLELKSVASIKGIVIPDHWFHYIREPEVLIWAAEKKAQLSKTRTVHGPGGETVVMYYHQLLGDVTPEMLHRGPKTSWKVVKERLEQAAIQRLLDSMGKEVKFKIPESVGRAAMGLPITILESNWALQNEGDTMGHCVAGYVHSCISGKSYIAHVDGPLPSTVEFGKREGSWEVFQHYGVRNAPPPVKNEKAVKEFVERLNG